MINKNLAFILTVVFVFTSALSVFSCAKNDDKPTNNDKDAVDNSTSENIIETTTEDIYDPKLPERNFEEYKFRILNINQDTMWWSIVDVDMPEQTGDVVNDAIYTRNRNMEEKYNFKIEETKMAGGTVDSTIKKSVNAGGDDFDLAIPMTTSAPSLAINNCFFDLYKVNNLNLKNFWWNTSVSDYFSMNKKLYFTTSDFILTDDDNVAILMYNKKIAENLGIESAEALYKTVEDGKWTWDKYTELCKAAVGDLNGNGAIDYKEDRFGLTTPAGWFYSAILAGFNETIIKKGEDDLPMIACKTDKFTESFEKMVTYMSQKDVIAREYTDFNGKTEEVFVNDRALFCGQVLSCVRLYKNMGSDFGLLPMPKYDEAQDKYYTYSLWSSCIAIPTTNPDPDRTGFILEALSAESSKLVVPAYYEISIGNKYLRDEGSYKMLDIILQNRIYDILVSIYNWGAFAGTFQNACAKGSTEFVSLFEKNETKIATAMQKTVDAYNDLN